MKLTYLPISQIVTLIVGKIVGIMFAAIVFSIEFEFSNLLNLFTTSSYGDEALVLISSYSDLFMFTLISSGFLISLFINSEKVMKLKQEDIKKYLDSKSENFMKTLYKIYGQSVNWLLFIWFSNFYILYNTLIGKTYLWIYLVVLILSLSVSIYFYFDFDREIQLSKHKLLRNEL